MRRNAILFILGLFFLSACGDDDPQTNNGLYSNGIFVINQGNFGSGSGSLSFIDLDDSTIANDVFFSSNDFYLGNVTQSMSKVGSSYVIANNNAESLVICNTADLKFEDEILGIKQPRFVQAINNSEAWVSSWGETGSNGQLTKIDVTSGELISTIETGGGPEKFVSSGSAIYVTNSGGFFRDSVIYKLNENEIEQTIIVGDNPYDLVVDGNGAIWVLCTGFTDWANPDNSTQGRLVKIENDVVVNSFELSNGANHLEISNNGQTLFYLADGMVKSQSINSNTLDNNEIYSGFYYSMIVGQDGLIYLADAKDFASTGEVIVIDGAGELINAYSVGLIPGGFLKVD